jgi:hypothetical protein
MCVQLIYFVEIVLSFSKHIQHTLFCRPAVDCVQCGLSPASCRSHPWRSFTGLLQRFCTAATLPPPLCQRCHHAAAANTALQMPLLCCLPPPCICHADTTAAALPPPPPRFRTLPPSPMRCHCRCRSAAAIAVLPPLPPLCRRHRPAAPLPAAAKLPPPHPTPPLHCLRRRHTARRCRTACRRRAAAPLPLPLCGGCHRASDVAAPLPPPWPCCRRRCCRPVTLFPRCLPPLSCRRRRYRHRCAAAAALALPTPLPRCPPLPRAAAALPPPLCQRCHRAANAVSVIFA